jgi:hypothetical protein
LLKYKQVQTYTRFVDEENFQLILFKYRRICLQLGLSADEIKRWESGITWSINDSGIMSIQSIPFSDEMMLEIDHVRLNVTVSIIIWKDNIDLKVLDEPWVELLIMVKPEDRITSEYETECEEVLFKIMSMLSEVFQDTGVFITNEMQDGEAFLGFVTNREDMYWKFDYAIIPSHLNELYKNIPKEFIKNSRPHGTGYIKRMKSSLKS